MSITLYGIKACEQLVTVVEFLTWGAKGRSDT